MPHVWGRLTTGGRSDLVNIQSVVCVLTVTCTVDPMRGGLRGRSGALAGNGKGSSPTWATSLVSVLEAFPNTTICSLSRSCTNYSAGRSGIWSQRPGGQAVTTEKRTTKKCSRYRFVTNNLLDRTNCRTSETLVLRGGYGS